MIPRIPTRKAPIDWEAARRRLTEAERAISAADAIPADRAREVLEDRARELARVPAGPEETGELIEVLCFLLAREHYALEVRYVHEVFRLSALTPLPRAPDFLMGITNLRGEIYPLIDLRRLFGVPVQGLTDLSRVVLIGAVHPELGILADEAQSVMTLRKPELLDPPESVAGIGREFLCGVTEDALIVLDGEKLLRHEQLMIDQD
jgi:purine-binding chemotaxis protein CheW